MCDCTAWAVMFVHSVCRGVDTFRQYGCVQSRVRKVVTRVAVVLTRVLTRYCIVPVCAK
jgi:hypothetical protein